jgi:hypothetical protein
MERGGRRAKNPSKPPKDSSMTNEENESMPFQVS